MLNQFSLLEKESYQLYFDTAVLTRSNRNHFLSLTVSYAKLLDTIVGIHFYWSFRSRLKLSLELVLIVLLDLVIVSSSKSLVNLHPEEEMEATLNKMVKLLDAESKSNPDLLVRDIPLNKDDAESRPDNIGASTTPNHGSYWTEKGKTTELSCMTRPSDVLVGKEVTSSWTRSSGQQITDPRFTVTRTGNLLIDNVDTDDSDTYVCHLTSLSNGFTRHRTEQHKLLVYLYPKHYLVSTIHYTGRYCDDEDVTAFRADHLRALRTEFCRRENGDSCSVKNLTTHCTATGGNMIFGLLVYLQGGYGEEDRSLCSGKCLYKKHLMKDESLKTNLHLFLRNRRVIDVYGQKLRLIDDTSFLGPYCGDGFELQRNVCLPCHPGHFIRSEWSKCEVCPMHTYQPRPGSKSCIDCPFSGVTVATGRTSSQECLSMAVISKTVPQVLLLWGFLLGVSFACVALAFCSCCQDCRWHRKHKLDTADSDQLEKLIPESKRTPPWGEEVQTKNKHKKTVICREYHVSRDSAGRSRDLSMHADHARESHLETSDGPGSPPTICVIQEHSKPRKDPKYCVKIPSTQYVYGAAPHSRGKSGRDEPIQKREYVTKQIFIPEPPPLPMPDARKVKLRTSHSPPPPSVFAKLQKSNPLLKKSDPK